MVIVEDQQIERVVWLMKLNWGFGCLWGLGLAANQATL